MIKAIPIPKISTKKIIELVVLSLVKNEDYNATGLVEKFESLGFTVPIGTIYPLLSEMRDSNLISNGFNEDTDPPERCYDITEKGLARLTQLTKEWRDIDRLIRHSSTAH